MAQSLADKVVVIVGGTSGIGISAAKACMAEGARVVLVGKSSEEAARVQAELGERCRAFNGDAQEPQTAAQAIAIALRDFGNFDALYHVAGGSGRKMGDGPLHEITDEGWLGTIALNQTSVFNSNRAAVQQFMKQQRGGSVLNLTSVLASSPSPRFFSTHAYAAAKAAIVGLTRSCAGYYAQHNIRFNALAPGLVDTPMSQRASNDSIIQRFIRTKQPLDGGRNGRTADLDAAAVFFLSDASAFVTGQVLAVDGGWSVSDGQIPE